MRVRLVVLAGLLAATAAHADAKDDAGTAEVEPDLVALRSACQRGHAQSCASLGHFFDSSRSRELAATLHESACDGGVVASCTRAGVLRVAERGFEAHGADILRRACGDKQGEACRELAHAVDRDFGDPYDPDEATRLLVRGCDHGDLESCREGARRMHSGEGAAADDDRALVLFRKACGPDAALPKDPVWECDGRKHPKLREGTAWVNRRMAPFVLRTAIRAAYAAFSACAEGTTGPKRTVSVTFRFAVAQDGHVASLATEKTDADPDVVTCMRRAVRATTFPPPEGGVITMVYPFTIEVGH